MRKQYDILVLSDPASKAKQKWPVRPSRRTKYQARRLNEPLIKFYDLGQVNNNEHLSDEPVWEDHPILKTPSYTTEADTWGSTGTWFAGVRYLLDAFDDTDYQAYSDMMFNYPENEWTSRYRLIQGIPGYGVSRSSVDFRFDMRFSLRDSSYSGADEGYIPDRLLSRAYLGTTLFNSTKETYLTDFHYYWHNDNDYAGYRDLDQMAGQINPYGDSHVGGYFGYSSDSADYKLTTSYDPSAPSADLGTPAGRIDVFLMPQVGFFMATANSTDWKTTEVLGLCYQVMPRDLWPRYVEGLAFGSGGQHGSDAAVAAWFDYQKGRSGVQFSSWTYTGTGDPDDFSYTETPGVVADWTGLSKWGSAVVGDDTNPDGYYYGKQARGAATEDSEPTYSTLFAANTSDANFGNALFRASDPFLTAVIRKGGRLYYCWDISNAVEGFGNFSVYDTLGQHDRFRLSRGITWDPDWIGASPPYPNDGTGGAFFD